MSKVLEMLAEVQKASRMLGIAEVETINALLLDLADAAVKNTSFILHENQKDLERMDKNDPKYDRLQLTQSRIEDIAKDIRNVASLPSPLNKIMEQRTLPNGLELSKIKVPIGVIGIIYEARPNVTFDVFSLCVKSGNACVLKGGSDAEFSNIAIIKVIKEVIKKHGLDENIVCLLPSDRAATTEMLNAVAYVDMIIPRGSQNLINYVRDNAKVPVIETGAGIVHIYFDESGDKEKGKKIIYNAKTRRVSVCNALDCLVIHRKRLNDLYFLVEDMTQKNVVIYADDESYASLQGKYPSNLLEKATEEHFGIEFLSYKMSVKTVSGIDEAIEHVTAHSSKHSESIISEDKSKLDKYLKVIDAAVVYANVSTTFTDGAQFGLGAEIGISTQKLHARGPMALEELTSYKWLVVGNGQIRN